MKSQMTTPTNCPITRLPFFEEIDGKMTFGGPFDSYTTPVRDPDDDTWHSEHFDHDRGHWIEGGRSWDAEELNLV